ncbi:YrrS family protein [Planococcus sp. CAU13]|uniref:YrrS family protein n=1 Tax=Planococcus sp. CAU13 TaxID=1541197 RepID=UPI00068D8300|nr:YrrS family protein [Planococcus sp. CAU13]
MAEEKKPYPSRVHKKNRSTSNTMLNVMIGLVFSLILIVGAFIFLGQTDSRDNALEPESVEVSTDTNDEASEEDSSEQQQDENADELAEQEADSDNTEEEAAEDQENAEAEEAEDKGEEEGTVTGGTITRQESNDPVVKETVINTSWEPIGTKQSGEHVSVYDTGSIDWKEKVDAITYATGLAESDMYIMHIGNGGGPQKSIGTVQSKDMSQKYRVHMEWVENEGWKPVKMDILNTVEGAY